MTLSTILRPRRIAVRLGRSQLIVRPGWADEWLIALEGGRLDAVVPGMVEEPGRARIVEELLTGEATDADLAAAAKDAIAMAAGRPWWEVMRLVAYSGGNNASITAGLMLEGIRPGEVTIGLWCTAVVAYVMPRLDEMKQIQFEADLKIPPGGTPRDMGGFDAVQF